MLGNEGPTKENITLILQSIFENPDKKSLPYLGSFIDTGTAYNVSNVKMRIEETLGDESPIAPLQMKYLSQIIDLCRLHQVKLFLYASPLSKNSYELIPDFYIAEFEKIKQELACEVPFIDYIQYTLPDSCFNDANHLNAVGAKIISK